MEVEFANGGAEFVPPMSSMVMMGLGGLLGLIGFVCFILVVIKMFQNNQAGLGIASIVLVFCGGLGYLVALIFGWIKSSEWNIKGLMMAYTVSLLGSAVLVGIGYALLISAVLNDPNLQQQMREMQQQMEQQNQLNQLPLRAEWRPYC